MDKGSNAALVTFAIYIVAVFLLAVISNRSTKGKEFVGEYFLGSRSFGVWAFALTFAATNASGGSFIGFPSLIYTHGWSLAVWIAGFMLVPLLSMGLIGKRLNQVARKVDAVTIPDVLRGRFGSSAVGLTATSLLVFFLFFYLLAQFKAGGKILSTLLADQPAFQSAVRWTADATANIAWVNQADPDYLVCLVLFTVAVVVYVVYGGFRAVVWTDVMQGIVMLVGVLLLLFMVLYRVGGLEKATRDLAKMTPPRWGAATIVAGDVSTQERSIPKGTWFRQDETVYRTAELAILPAGEASTAEIKILQLTTPLEIQRVNADEITANLSLQQITTEPYAHGADQPGAYVSNPGPHPTNSVGFLAIGTAISFFFFWPFGAAGQPGNMVRLMSFKDTRTLRYSIVTVAVYYSFIYLSLVVIFCCGRVLMSGMEVDPDRTMPDLAALISTDAGVPWLAGILVAAPFAAVMSSVDSFLLMVSSAVARDVYQGHLNPDASESRMKWISYGVTVVVGVLAILFVLNPPNYLQDLIVFASGGLAACFFVPITFGLYWRRMTAAGAVASMIAGMLVHLGLTYWGYLDTNEFRPYEPFGLNPLIWDLFGSSLAAVIVSKQTSYDWELAEKLFGTKND